MAAAPSPPLAKIMCGLRDTHKLIHVCLPVHMCVLLIHMCVLLVHMCVLLVHMCDVPLHMCVFLVHAVRDVQTLVCQM